MSWSLSLTTPPVLAALDLATEVRQQLRLEVFELADQAAVLQGYIDAAEAACEEYTDRQLITATWTLNLERWNEPGIYRCENGIGRIRLPKPPLQSVTSIKYTDVDGIEATWSSLEYQLAAPVGPTSQRAEIVLKDGFSWPDDVLHGPAAIRILFVAGYGLTYAAVPASLRAGMLLRVAESFERREEALTGTTQSQNEQTARTLWSSDRTW